MSLLVLDASVALKWYLPRAGETLVGEAFEVLRQYRDHEIQLITPGFLWAEFGNVLWKAVRQGRMPEDAAAKAIAEMRGWKIPDIPLIDLVPFALSIAVSTGRTVYDCLYVALAVQSGGELVTADERLANALAARYPVKWLGLFSST